MESTGHPPTNRESRITNHESRITLYDTTLRDGMQGEGIAFTVQDKLKIVEELDGLGIHYVEGGWPGSNPKDVDFFEQVRHHRWKTARLAAFGSTRRPHTRAEDDLILRPLLESEAPTVTLVGKSWDFHVREVLRVSEDENLAMIEDSFAFLKRQGREAFFDAEHFFDGYQRSPDYALAALRAALNGGADLVVLCDTNGGAMPWDVERVVREVQEATGSRVGIHTHNDGELGVANALAAVRAGAVQVQGTMNGWGERIGNCSLCSVIPNLQLKMGLPCLSDAQLRRLTETALAIYEIANLPIDERQPFVGRTAFAHKAGTHVDAVMKNQATCEHIDPDLVGNSRRFLISELSGGSTVLSKAKEVGMDLTKRSPQTRQILSDLADLENQGYVFEGAEASFELLMHKAMGSYEKLFDLRGFRVIVEKRGPQAEVVTEATLKVAVDGEERLTVAEGDGPVNALDGAMRKALEHFYPELARIKLTDFKVRIVNVKAGTAAKVRVLVESQAQDESWSTIGVSENIIEASWHALVDAVEYGLMKLRK